MNTRQLEYFIAVADTLNFTRAARNLFVTQTAVTQQIHALEKELDLQLFHRTKRHVELTPAGKLFLQPAREVLQELQDTLTRCHSLSAGITGSLTVGIVRDYVDGHLVEVLDSFCRKYPNISLQFLRLSVGGIQENLKTGKVDLAINVQFHQDPFLDFQTRVLCHSQLLAVLSHTHPLARKAALTSRDLLPEPLFLLDTQGLHRAGEQQEMVLRLFDRQIRREPIQYIPDVETILLLAAANQGIGLVPDYAPALSLFRDKVKVLPLEETGTPVVVAAQWDSKNPNPSLPLLLQEL